MRAVMILAVLVLTGCASKECRCAGEEIPHVTLQLSPEWKCQRQGVETVCRTEKRDRMVIHTIKERGSSDTLEQYKEHLPNAKLTEINGQTWVDSTQVSSELNGYTTRYLATVDGGFAALVTFSAQTKIFPKFVEDMRPVIGTLILRR